MSDAERDDVRPPLTIPDSRLLSPRLDGEDTAPFWEGTGRGELRVQRCASCGHRRFPPSPVCRECGDLEAEWERVEGTPTLYSWVVVERSTHAEIPGPFCVALAELERGLRVPGNLLYDRETETLRAGLPLEVGFGTVGDVHVPVYRVAVSSDD